MSNAFIFQLGVVDAFNPTKAKFESISRSVPLYVTAVTHVATVEVTTEGTVGAAASGNISSFYFPIVWTQ